jgi:hypothetical protein
MRLMKCTLEIIMNVIVNEEEENPFLPSPCQGNRRAGLKKRGGNSFNNRGEQILIGEYIYAY